MKKIIQRILIFTIPLFVLFHTSITTFAISDEEKVLFDILGVEYNVTADGEFDTFQVDLNTPKISVEAKQAFMEKYQNGTKIGTFRVSVSEGENAETAKILISSTEDVSLYISDTVIEYKNPNTEYTRFEYDNEGSDKPLYIRKLKYNPENHNRPLGDSYCLNYTGDYALRYRSDAENDYRYDEDGNLMERYELATNIIYDANDNSIKKLVYSSDGGAIFAPTESAEEIQKKADEENLNYSALSECIKCYEEAQQFDMDVSEYLERYKQLKAYEEEVQRTANIDEKKKILGITDKSSLWNQPKYLTESDYAILQENWSISEHEIAEEVARLINEYRVENGVEELDFSDSLLQQVADIRAVELTYVMDKAHSRPWVGTATAFGISENAASMPITYESMISWHTNESIARTLFEGWRRSPGHNANMLNVSHVEGSVGIKLAYYNGNLIVCAGTPFYDNDYEKIESGRIRDFIAAGPQTNYSSVAEYSSELSSLIHEYTTREDVIQKVANDAINYIDKDAASENTTSEHNYGLKVLDTSGNKFQLPNGVDWVWAEVKLEPFELFWSADGQVHYGYKGDIYFYDEGGNKYRLFLHPEQMELSQNPFTFGNITNNFSGDTIIIAPCAFTTIDHMGMSYQSEYVTNVCYYITNSEMIVLDHTGNVVE